MRDADTRGRIRKGVDRSVLVEAAAGTGKTYLIVRRIIHGLRKGAFSLAQTVAITFTEKAAGELEERLRERLSAERHRADLPELEMERLRQAAEELDRAQVSTIHSFCARLLRAKPAEAGIDPDFTVLQQAPAALLKEECWTDWLESQVSEDNAVLMEALRAGAKAKDLKRAAFDLAEAPEILEMDVFSLPCATGSPDALLEGIRRTAPAAARACEELIMTRGNPESRALLRLSKQVMEAKTEAALRRAAYEAAGVDVEKALGSFKSNRDQARPHLEAFSEATRRLGAHLAARVFRWAAGFVERYGRQKRRRSVLDFQDLLLLSARLLRENLEVRRHFQRRFRAFFVDEFQDTDPLQAELIAYLCERKGPRQARRLTDVKIRDGALMAVGDPKQSVYRFRRADVQMYEEFKQLLGPGRMEKIYCNFRSDAPLLEWFNSFFEIVFGRPGAEGVYQAEHVPLEPGMEEQKASGAALLPPAQRSFGGQAVAVLAPDPQQENASWKADTGRRYEAQYLARMIHETVTGGLELPGLGPVRYGDFALLLRALTSVNLYEQALDGWGVPYRAIGGKHFYSRIQTAQTLALLRAVNDPLDAVDVVAALRSPYFGLSDEDLLRYRKEGAEWNYLRPGAAGGPVREAMDQLAQWHGVRNRMAPHLLLEKVFRQTGALQAYALKPAGRQRVAALRQLARRLRALGEVVPTFGAVVRRLSSIEEAELPEEESTAVEPGDDYVQILSMHKAKGLEFPVVVLPDLGRKFPDKGGLPPLLLNRRDGRVGLRLMNGVQTENCERLREEEQGNVLAELRRLLYVACTRAERLLVLPLHWHVASESFHTILLESGLFSPLNEIPPGESRKGVHYIDTRGWHRDIAIAPVRQPLAREDAQEVASRLKARARWKQQRRALVERLSSRKVFVSPSALAHERGGAVEATLESGGQGGMGLGTVFHRVMSAIPLGADSVDRKMVEGLARIAADELDLASGPAGEAARLALEALEHKEFRALVEEAQALRQEVEFCVPLAELGVSETEQPGFVEGSIDLVVLGENRTLILDYKTDAEVAPARYWSQLGLYGMVARHCGLAPGEVELALFYVRAGQLLRRSLDDELLASLDEMLRGASVASDGIGQSLESG